MFAIFKSLTRPGGTKRTPVEAVRSVPLEPLEAHLGSITRNVSNVMKDNSRISFNSNPSLLIH